MTDHQNSSAESESQKISLTELARRHAATWGDHSGSTISMLAAFGKALLQAPAPAQAVPVRHPGEYDELIEILEEEGREGLGCCEVAAKVIKHLASQPSPGAPVEVPPEVMERRRKGLSDYEKPPLGQPPSWLQEQEKIAAPHNGSSAEIVTPQNEAELEAVLNSEDTRPCTVLPDGKVVYQDDTCECPKCGRMHRSLGFGKPPSHIRDVPQAALIQTIEDEARRYAEMYPQSSDGRNTFVIFADWVAGLSARPAPAPSTQHAADLLQVELDKLGAPITYTACKAIVAKLATVLLASSPLTRPKLGSGK